MTVSAVGARERLAFVVESGTDVRLVSGLQERFDLSLLLRRIEGGVEISQPLPDPPRELEVGPGGRLGFARSVSRWLRARRRSIDRVIVQGYGPAALAALLAGRSAGLPVSLLVCSPVAEYYECRRTDPQPGQPWRRRQQVAIRLLARACCSAAAHALVLSRHLGQVVTRHGFRGALDLVPVYGVDLGRFRPREVSQAELRGRLGLPAGELVFFSSRVAPEKDAATLLTAFAALVRRGRDTWLVHASGGWQRFMELARARGIESRVIARDAVHPERELPAWLQASDLLVQASREEGLGFSPLEALACEVPVVSSAVGGLRETIIDGTTGWSVPPADPGRLAAAMEAALDDPAEGLRRAREGRSLVRAGYERGLAFDRLEAALRSPGSCAPELVGGRLSCPA